MRILWHLVRTELHGTRREWLGLASLLLISILLGISPYGTRVILQAQSQAGRFAEEEGPGLKLGCADVQTTVAAQGELPGWLELPVPLRRAEEARVLIRAEGPAPHRLEVLPMMPEAIREAMTVRGCLWDRIKEQQEQRLSALGITERPGWVVRVDYPFSDSAGAPILPLSELGGGLLSAVMMVLMGVYTDIIPRTRASGYLESLMVTPMQPAILVLSWWTVGVLGALLGVAMVSGAYLGAGAATGAGAIVDIGLPQVLTGVATLAAMALYPFIGVADARSALLTALPIGVAVVLVTGMAVALESILPGLGAAMPVGGIVAALLDLVDKPRIALISGALSTIALLQASVRRLKGLDLAAQAAGGVERRWAAGDYIPEALVLFVLSVAGASAWMPTMLGSGDPATAFALSQGMFILLPVLFFTWPASDRVSVMLALSRPPPLRSWALTPLVAMGAVAGVLLLSALGGWLLPIGATGFGMWLAALDRLGLPAALVLMAGLPAVCEELLFRGGLLSMLRRRMPLRWAVLAQAAMFAMAHATHHKLLPMLGLGLLLGLLTIRCRSVLPAIYVRISVAVAMVLTGPHLDYIGDLLTPRDVLLGALAAALAPALAWISGPGRAQSP